MIATPDTGRNRAVSLTTLHNVADPVDVLPLENSAAVDAAGSVLIAISEVLEPPERESLLHLLRPDEKSLRDRARIAGCSPNTIRNTALRFKRALNTLRPPTATAPKTCAERNAND